MMLREELPFAFTNPLLYSAIGPGDGPLRSGREH